MGVSTMFLRCAYTNIPFIYRVSTVYLPYIYRISTVVDSELIAGRACPLSPPEGGRWLWDGQSPVDRSRMCGLRPNVEWQGCTATLRSPNTRKIALKVNFLLFFLCLCVFFCTFAG